MQAVQREEKLTSLRQGFKYLNYGMLWMWHLGLGWLINIFPPVIGRIMVLMHIGRKSGNRYHVPLNYAEIDGVIHCMAGFGSQSQWYKNVMACPDIELWLPDGWWRARAKDVTDSENRIDILRQILKASGFATIAFEGINPYTISDEALQNLMDEYGYRLLQIERIETCTGEDGPGQYAWIWSIVVFGLFFFRKRRK